MSKETKIYPSEDPRVLEYKDRMKALLAPEGQQDLHEATRERWRKRLLDIDGDDDFTSRIANNTSYEVSPLRNMHYFKSKTGNATRGIDVDEVMRLTSLSMIRPTAATTTTPDRPTPSNSMSAPAPLPDMEVEKQEELKRFDEISKEVEDFSQKGSGNMYIKKREIHELFIDHDRRDELREQEIDINMDDVFDAAGRGEFKGLSEVNAPIIHPKHPGQDFKISGEAIRKAAVLRDSDGERSTEFAFAAVSAQNAAKDEDSNKDISDDSHHFSPRLRELLASYGHQT